MRRTPAGGERLLGRAYRPLVERRTWQAVLFNLTDLPVAWLAGGLLGVVVGTSVLLAPLALLVVAAALAGLRRLAGAERWRARLLLGVEVQAPPSLDRGPGIPARTVARMPTRDECPAACGLPQGSRSATQSRSRCRY